MIRVESLRKAYGPIVAVDGISLEIATGETFGLLGPNGAGKTTTIHLITGALKPDAGQVAINGQNDPTNPETRRLLGVAPQAEALYDELTAEENLVFFGRLYGLAGKQLADRVAWALDFAELADRRRDLVDGYSGGMKRRLNLACALVHDPPALMFDEPTAGVDPQSRNHLMMNIEALAAAGKTILYTTHYMEEAQRLCDRVAIMDHGKILALDTVDNLISQYAGRSRVEATLSEVPADTANLPGTVKDRRLVFETDRPFEEMARLADSGLRYDEIRVERPNLETVFLNLTGRSLRD